MQIEPPPHIFADRLPPHLSCKFFHFETYVPKPAKGLVCGVGVQTSKNSSLMKTSTKCVFLYVREELAKNFTQTKKSKKCWVKCSQSGQRAGGRGGVQKSKNSSQMKKSKKCVVLHDRGELAKNSTQTKKWKKCWVICSQGGQRAGVRGVKKSKNSSQLKKSKKCFVVHVLGELPKNSTQTRNRRNVELYVPKLAQRPELGIRLGVLSFQYKHW